MTIDKICKICQKTFKIYPYRNNTALYCSRSCSSKSRPPWNKDKSMKDYPQCGFQGGHKGFKFFLGKKLSKEHIEKLRKAKLGKRGKEGNNWQGGKIEKLCLKCNKEFQVNKSRSETSRFCSEICFLKSYKNRYENTLIEVIIENELNKRKIKYIKQVSLCKNRSKIDFYLPQTKTAIYCDGDYWHTRDKKIMDSDYRISKSLIDNGYNVLRFWEFEINNPIIRNKLIEMIIN